MMPPKIVLIGVTAVLLVSACNREKQATRQPVDSGSPPASAGAGTKRAKWTIMVYLNAKNNLEDESIVNFRQMAETGSTDDVNVILDYGRTQWQHAYRMRITKGMPVDSSPPTTSTDVIDLGDQDMGAVTTLRSFVADASKAYPADH